jgi:very-short-patch-repair endonuclease
MTADRMCSCRPDPPGRRQGSTCTARGRCRPRTPGATSAYRRHLRRAPSSTSRRPRPIGRCGDSWPPRSPSTSRTSASSPSSSRAGRARFARVLATGPAPTRSELEDRVRDLVLAGGFPPPDVNVALRIGGRRVIPDLRWPERRLCIEADSLEWHDNPQARRDDLERQALLEQDGERVLRVTWEQAVAHPAQTLRRIGLAYSGGPGSGPRAASSASPIASTMSSVPRGPTSSIPTGSPSPVRPAGTDRAGIPALEA